MTATRTSGVPSCSDPSAPAREAEDDSSSVKRSSRSPVPRPWVAETAIGSPRPSAWSSAASGSSAAESTLLATTTTGTSARRRISATSASPWRRPARASSTIATASASAIASRAWSWTARESESAAARSTPPVSMSSKRTPFHSHSSALRSRVTPASLVDDRLAPAAEPVDQRRLADVRKADDRDPREPGHRVLRPARARARVATTPSTTASNRGARSCRARPRPRRPAARRARASRSRASRSACAASTSSKRSPRLVGAPARALFVRRRQEDLQRRVGADHGADVAALGDVVARPRSARAGARPSPRGPRDAPRPARRPRPTSGARIACADVLSRRAARRCPSKASSSPRGQLGHRLAVVEVDPGPQGREGDAAVHRPRVEVGEAERRGDAARDGGLAGPGGPVDRDHHGGGEDRLRGDGDLGHSRRSTSSRHHPQVLVLRRRGPGDRAPAAGRRAPAASTRSTSAPGWWSISGTVEISEPGRRDGHAAGAGLLAIFDPNERHEVAATEDARLLLVLSPWPGEGHPRPPSTRT